MKPFQVSRLDGEPLRFRKVPDDEYSRLRSRFPLFNAQKCPTCGGTETFHYRGEEWECDCKIQRALHRHYLFANIGVTYHSLGFDDLFEGKEYLREFIEGYLDNWHFNYLYGRGVVFWGSLGTGKTTAQLLILKELVKRGEKCWFNAFSTAVNDYINEKEKFISAVRSSVCYALDEVIDPVSEKQNDLYQEVIEQIIRYRVENSLPTLVGTNLSPDMWEKYYPRVSSLLAFNSEFFEVAGDDNRRKGAKDAVAELIANKEVRPIK